MVGIRRSRPTADGPAVSDRYEAATQRCPACHRTFRTLADEAGSHPCPRCGWFAGDPATEGDDMDEVEGLR